MSERMIAGAQEMLLDVLRADLARVTAELSAQIEITRLADRATNMQADQVVAATARADALAAKLAGAERWAKQESQRAKAANISNDELRAQLRLATCSAEDRQKLRNEIVRLETERDALARSLPTTACRHTQVEANTAMDWRCIRCGEVLWPATEPTGGET